jgi:hypothetical protein
MSDILQTSAPEIPGTLPALLSRLRPGRYTSPAGAEHLFQFDTLTRSRSKNVVAHSMPDTDDTVLQDMGSSLQVFPLDVYFIGENCDTAADAFYASLFERYTPDSPGILHHPRWGDITVMPFGSPEQSETFSGGGGGISRITVEFRETRSLSSRRGTALSSAGVVDKVKKIDASALDKAQAMVGATKAQYAKFKQSIRNKVKLVTGFIDGVTDLTQDIANEVEALTQELYSLIDTGASPVLILSQIGTIWTTIAQVPSQGLSMVEAYIDMAADIIDSYGSDIASASTNDERTSLALSYQYVGTMAVACTALSATSATYEIRDQVASAVDNLSAQYLAYLAKMDAAVASLDDGIENMFTPDHDIGSDLQGAIYDTQSLLMDRAYSLAVARRYRLTAPTDPLTETWLRYGDLDRLGFYCSTNKIVGDEFIEIPSGRELVYYA